MLTVSPSLTTRFAPPVEDYLARAEQVILPFSAVMPPMETPQGKLHVGVDLGTAYTVLVVLDEAYQPVAGIYQFAQVVRDGLVVDFIGATDLLRAMKHKLEERIGRELFYAASGYPPGVPRAEVRATANVLEAAGFICSGLMDEPSAANQVLQLEHGAIVDVGGGTTGIAIIQDGKVVYTADEPTGGTHFSLVIAGALDISFEEAERLKTTSTEQDRLFPLVRPVMEKVASITARHVHHHPVDQVVLVGGTASFKAIDRVVEEYTGIPTCTPTRPLFVTPLGIAMQNNQEE